MNIRLKEVLKENSCTAKSLAEKLGSSPQYISNIVSGRQNISLSSLERIAEILGVPMWHFFISPDQLPGGAVAKGTPATCPHCGKEVKIVLEK